MLMWIYVVRRTRKVRFSQPTIANMRGVYRIEYEERDRERKNHNVFVQN